MPAAWCIIAIRGNLQHRDYLTANDDFLPDGFSAEEEFPNNERRASRESDKDSIVDSAVIYLCIQSWATRIARAMMFIIAMWRNSVYLPYQTTGNLSIAVLSKCPINNNLITLRPFRLQLDCQASRINDL